MAKVSWQTSPILNPGLAGPVKATIHLGDCIPAMAEKLEPESVELLVTSIPFASLFQYSAKTEDVGNSPDAGLDFVGSQFGLHMRFWAEQVYRVMKPGSVVCIHIQQLITYKIQHGFEGRRDFRGAVIDLVSSAGFNWVFEIAIAKNPQRIAQAQKLHSLLFVTGYSDSRSWAPAVNDYILAFRKPGDGEPVRCLYHVDKNPNGWVSQDEWIKWARGVWDDIRETDVLEGWRNARDEGDEKHPCPLQLEVVRRCIKLWSNPGAVVMDPYMGIGTVACIAVEQGRHSVGFELKESFHAAALRNVAKWQAERAIERHDLFEWAGVSAG